MSKVTFEEYQYTVAKHFICALVNGDYTALNDEEIVQLETFLENLPPRDYTVWNPPDEEDYDNWTHCEICRLFSDCQEITLMVPQKMGQVKPVGEKMAYLDSSGWKKWVR